MSSRIDQMLQFQQSALNLRATRQELIASNIANADTPNYKARDIDFASALQGALSGNGQKLPVAATSPQHLAGGNTVDMDVERSQFADNALRYEASLTFVSNDVKNVLAALQG
jgi:flagellar basal-body rod protein FlgB